LLGNFGKPINITPLALGHSDLKLLRLQKTDKTPLFIFSLVLD
jgi:hypothetical protein